MSAPVTVTGEEDVIAAMAQLERLAEDLSAPHRAILSKLVPAIAAATPKRTGALAVSWAGTAAAGAATVVSPLRYAGPVEFGTPRMAGAHMVSDTLASSTDEIVAGYEEAFAAVAAREGFGVRR